MSPLEFFWFGTVKALAGLNFVEFKLSIHLKENCFAISVSQMNSDLGQIKNLAPNSIHKKRKSYKIVKRM